MVRGGRVEQEVSALGKPGSEEPGIRSAPGLRGEGAARRCRGSSEQPPEQPGRLPAHPAPGQPLDHGAALRRVDATEQPRIPYNRECRLPRVMTSLFLLTACYQPERYQAQPPGLAPASPSAQTRIETVMSSSV